MNRLGHLWVIRMHQGEVVRHHYPWYARSVVTTSGEATVPSEVISLEAIPCLAGNIRPGSVAGTGVTSGVGPVEGVVTG